MSAIAYKFKCANCGIEFEAPEVPEMSYGLFVMRSNASDDTAFLDASNDTVFMESYELVKQHPLLAKENPDQSGKVQQVVFTATCEKTSNGESLIIGLSPKCPSCGLRKPASWLQITPVRQWPLPKVRHDSWNTMKTTEKADAIDRAIHEYFSKRHPL